MKKHGLGLVVVAGAVLLAAAMVPGMDAKAQQSAATDQVQANEVVLPVTVRDKKGALVTSLKPTDVSLTEDGRAQKIKSFTIQSDQPYLVGLLVQTSRGMDSSRSELRTAADKFVDQMLTGTGAKPNQAFLIHFDREVELLADFTTKPGDIHQELDTLGPTHAANRDRSQGPETSDTEQEEGGERGQHNGASGSRGGTDLYDAIYLAADELMKSKTGRKSLIVFSDGVDRGSKENLTDAIDAADHANLSIYTIYIKGEEERQSNGFPGQGGGRHGGGWPGGGGGYPGGGGGYPGGGRHGGGSGESKPAIDGKKIMEQLANKTGGHYFEVKKKENLNDVYAQIAEELKGQYLLTFTPDKPDPDGGYHKIIVKTNDDNLKVQTREGYYAVVK